MTDLPAAQQIYDRLWADARALFATGCVKTDPHLLNRGADTRRGITVVIRPTPDLIGRISGVMDDLRTLAPGQHLYRPDELHVTILSLISASTGFNLDAVPLDTYRALLGDLFAQVKPLTIHFNGVTASPDSVFIFGQAEHDALNTLRDRLRESLTRAGLGDMLDRRYRIVTAHSTILRFQSQPENLPALIRYLEGARTRDMGTFTADAAEFTFNDWYMSHDVVRVLARYPFSA